MRARPVPIDTAAHERMKQGSPVNAGHRSIVLRSASSMAGVLLAMGWLAISTSALAGTTGKLSGRVVDKKKQPLAGVNIAVPLARLGALTDADGRYVILNIPAGAYDVKVGLLGYRATTVTGVEVSADNTATLDVTLDEAPIAMTEVVVSAQRPVVDLKQTSSTATITRSQIHALPVQELQEIVNLQAGVVSQGGDLHFRGGRGGEVQFQVDGVSVNNAYDNKSSLRIDRSLLEEVQVISGTFDAEYGQAMSGVVNAVLRRGSEKFRWDGEVLSGGFLYDVARRDPSSTPVFFRSFIPQPRYAFWPAGEQNYQLSASGPLFVPKTTYLTSGSYHLFDDYVRGTRVYTPWLTPTGNPVAKATNPDGDLGQEPLGFSREWSGIGKVTNRSIPNVEIGYQAIVNYIDSRRADWNYRFDPEGLTRQHTFSVAHGVDVTHTVSKATFYNVSLRQNYFDYKDLAFDNLYDPRYDLAGPPKNVPGFLYDAFVQGVDLNRFKQNTDAIVAKSSFTHQVNRDQTLKLGAEMQWPQVKFGSPGVLSYVTDSLTGRQFLARYDHDPPKFPGVQLNSPLIGAAFAQEDGEWNDLRVRAGFRFDFFDARSSLPSDLENPANSIQGAPLSHPVRTSAKYSISPRVGVSYPVTSDASLFFAYGHFYQMPSIGDVFTNSNYGVLSDLQADVPNFSVMGNPDIKPEKTVQYQFGYKQRLTDWLGLDTGIFYKDIRDLLGVQFVTTYNGAEYARLTNVDFGGVTGVTIALSQRRRGLFSSSIDYTWQLAQGNSSDPRETATRASAGEDPRPRQVPFNWDQRHTLNATVEASRDSGFSLSAVVRVASGQPYTPVRAVGFGFGLEDNSGRHPASMAVDLRGEKTFGRGPGAVRAFARVFNVFDTRYFNGYVFDTTGSPYYAPTADLVRDADQLANPTRFFAPRKVQLGVSMQVGQ